MADAGLVGSLSGYSAKEAQDYLLQFKSSWPLLKLQMEGTSSGTVGHGLSYPPAYFLTKSEGQFDQFSGDSWAINEGNLSNFGGAGSQKYFIFRLPLDQNFLAPTISGSTAAGSVDHDHGFALAKDGKSVYSTDMRDFALHSGSRSLMVHKVDCGNMTNSGGGLGWERFVSHGLNYTPLVFVYMKPSTNFFALPTDRYGLVMPPVGVSGRYFTVDSSTVYITVDNIDFTGNPFISVVIFKNPLANQIVNVVYP